jgi:hypothetical protein
VVAAALELGRHGGLASAGDPLDEIVAHAHGTSINCCQRYPSSLAESAVGAGERRH